MNTCRTNKKVPSVLLAIIVALFLLASCGEDRTYEYDEKTAPNHLMQDLMIDWYLWGDSLKELDWRQYFVAPEQFIPKLTAQSKANDKWSYCLIDTIETDPFPCGSFNHVDSYGMDVVLMTDPTGETTKQYARVVTVYKDSPAERCGLQRNDFIGQVDRNKMASTVISNLVNGRSRSLVVSRLAVNSSDAVLFWETTDTLIIEKSERVPVAPVLVSRMLDEDIAYLMLSNLEDTSAISSAFMRLQSYAPANLILDLRLCNRGTLEGVCKVAGLISNVRGTLLQTFWNKRKAGNNRTYDIADSHASYDYSLYFIIGSYTQGAAEWLIRGLQAASSQTIKVVGNKSAGQNVLLGNIPTEYRYTICPAVAFVADREGNYDYSNGIEPDETIDEMSYALLYRYGDTREVLVNHILANR